MRSVLALAVLLSVAIMATAADPAQAPKKEEPAKLAGNGPYVNKATYHKPVTDAYYDVQYDDPYRQKYRTEGQGQTEYYPDGYSAPATGKGAGRGNYCNYGSTSVTCPEQKECPPGEKCECSKVFPGENLISCNGECVNPLTSESCCGIDNKEECRPGQVCKGGNCQCPEAGEIYCKGACRDTNTDDKCCGDDKIECTGGRNCVAGTCRCPTDLVWCNDKCQDIKYNSNFCGETCAEAAPCRSDQICDNGHCKCPPGQYDCGGKCYEPNSPDCCGGNQQCSGGEICNGNGCVCPADRPNKCNGVCRDISTCDAELCGPDCDNLQPCYPPKVCDGGQCRCPTGFYDCRGECVDPDTSEKCCGGTNTDCDHDQVCLMGRCKCPPPLEWCPIAQKCVDKKTDSGNCGDDCKDCGNQRCCRNGNCKCPAGQEYCGSDCVDTKQDKNNCGACDSQCNLPQVCINGFCKCPVPGQILCGGRCVDISSDPSKCGEDCGSAIECEPNQVCTDGKCGCPPGWVDCNGACYPGATSADCPTCTQTCPTPPSKDDPGRCGDPFASPPTCEICHGNKKEGFPSCRNGVCVACQDNGENKGTCFKNSDCCSCECFSPSGTNKDGQCRGDTKRNQGGNSCKAYNIPPYIPAP